jgi:hypothetical protein
LPRRTGSLPAVRNDCPWYVSSESNPS